MSQLKLISLITAPYCRYFNSLYTWFRNSIIASITSQSYFHVTKAKNNYDTFEISIL